jgi:hypothetical protein
MNVLNENEQNAIIDALKYTSDVVSALTLKINNQDEEIIFLKNKVLIMEEEIKKMFQKITILNAKNKQYSNVELKTDDDNTNISDQKTKTNKSNNQKIESSDISTEEKTKNFEVTSIADTEINNLRKIKAGQLVDKLIQKKNEINNMIEKKIEQDQTENEPCINEPEKKVEDTVITRRRNKIMRRF